MGLEVKDFEELFREWIPAKTKRTKEVWIQDMINMFNLNSFEAKKVHKAFETIEAETTLAALILGNAVDPDAPQMPDEEEEDDDTV